MKLAVTILCMWLSSLKLVLSSFFVNCRLMVTSFLPLAAFPMVLLPLLCESVK